MSNQEITRYNIITYLATLYGERSWRKEVLKRKLTILIAFLLVQLFTTAIAQEKPIEPPPAVEQALENLTENLEDAEIENDTYLQDMQFFLNHPINLNYAGESDLNKLKIITALQIQNLISYRKLLGNFVSIYELQAVPSWNISIIRKILPFVTVEEHPQILTSVGERLRKGDNSMLARVSQVLETSKGYLVDVNSGKSYYPGSRQKIFLRYKYAFKNLLQYGITAEKDAGEQFFKGAQKQGFDFYSAHLFVRNVGKINAIAVGDFVVNLGQGLTQWQSLAFKKSSDVLNIKRQADILRPYNSAGEINFHRGAGLTIQKNDFQATAFISFRKLDANFIADTLTQEDYVTSLQTSGYHRTKSESADKNVQSQLTLGGNLSYNKNNVHLGFNGVHYTFKLPIQKSALLYNSYSLSGKKWGNYSVDYSYTYKNLHFFGEAAFDEKMNKAFVNGLLLSTDTRVSMSFLYRNISRGYQALYSNAFTESTFPSNEKGLYAGISINPTDFLRIDAYADYYSFPWLRYRVDAPNAGNDYLLQITYRPKKEVEIYSRYRSERKAINFNPDNQNLNPVVVRPKQSWRTQFSYKLNPGITLRSRIELLWFDKNGASPEQGFLTYTDVLYKPLLKKYSGNIRLQYFQTDGYNSRVYAYENDVLYSFSIPVFFDKGYRYYININYDLTRKWGLWVRMAQTVYPDKSVIGSGLDEIKGSRKTELKLQSIYNF